MNQKRIVIDGKVYNSVDEMSPNVRSQYEAALRNFDKNQNGTPDLLENTNLFGDKNKDGVLDVFENMPAFQSSVGTTMQSTKIIVNGQTYDSVDQLPPDVRAKYEQAMGAMDANKNGIPDFVEGIFGASNRTNTVATSFGTASPPRSKPMLVSSTIEPESSGG